MKLHTVLRQRAQLLELQLKSSERKTARLKTELMEIEAQIRKIEAEDTEPLDPIQDLDRLAKEMFEREDRAFRAALKRPIVKKARKVRK